MGAIAEVMRKKNAREIKFEKPCFHLANGKSKLRKSAALWVDPSK